MAKRASSNDAPSTGPEHNLGARREAIRALHRDLIPLEAEKERIIEEIRKKRQEFKADTGVALVDFDAARRLVLMEDEDRQAKVENFAEVYKALLPGEQLDWVAAAEAGPEAGPEAEKTIHQINLDGSRAGLDGKAANDNPYDVGSKEHSAWHNGWMGGQKQLAANLKAKKEPAPAAA